MKTGVSDEMSTRSVNGAGAENGKEGVSIDDPVNKALMQASILVDVASSDGSENKSLKPGDAKVASGAIDLAQTRAKELLEADTSRITNLLASIVGKQVEKVNLKLKQLEALEAALVKEEGLLRRERRLLFEQRIAQKRESLASEVASRLAVEEAKLAAIAAEKAKAAKADASKEGIEEDSSEKETSIVVVEDKKDLENQNDVTMNGKVDLTKDKTMGDASVATSSAAAPTVD